MHGYNEKAVYLVQILRQKASELKGGGVINEIPFFFLITDLLHFLDRKER